MNDLIRGAIKNTPAMNTLMLGLLLVGGICLFSMRREVFPEFDLEIVLVTVPYPGASPEEVEEGICQKIEEAVRSVEGIKKQTSVAKEGSGTVVLELTTSVDPQRVLNEVRSEVDRIPSFPLLAEDPEVKQITLRQPAIKVGVLGPAMTDSEAELQLRAVAESVREDIGRLPAVSQANITGAKDFQIDVEISESTLRRHGLTLQQVANIIRRENLELPGGTIRTESQDILVKGKNKGTIGSDIEQIPLVTDPSGVVLTVGDLGQVRDEFTDVESSTQINGRPGLVVSVDRTATEDLLKMTDAVHNYVQSKTMPAGYELVTWSDRSVEVRDRLALLVENGLQGLVLVVVLLAIFLNFRLAFWVSAGIPISILGACIVLYFAGHTMNMLTTFTFVMALGIVVDDAIVVSENIFAHQLMGKKPLEAAIDGTLEVAGSVAASVATTIIAFMPLFFVSGVMGKFIAVMPLTMISILLMSLFEAIFVLPCHLAHESHDSGLLAGAMRFRRRLSPPMAWTFGALVVANALLIDFLMYPFRRFGVVLEWLNLQANRAVDWVSDRLYAPLMRRGINNPMFVLSCGIALLIVAMSLVVGGVVPFEIMPKIDSNTIEANLVFPDGTPASVTDAATARLVQAIEQVNQKYADQGEPVLALVRRSVGYVSSSGGPMMEILSDGANLGSVTAELQDTSQRTIPSLQILADWRAAAGKFSGAESVTFASAQNGPGGKAIEFKLLTRSGDMRELERAVDETTSHLRGYPGVLDVADDNRPGKWEFQLRVKPEAQAMGVPLAAVAETVRASYYGEEVMRLQRGRHEVKLMVRYPREDRRSLADFDQIRVRTGDGSERPVTELADVRIERSYSEINRVNQLRSITITGDVDTAIANGDKIVRDMQTHFMPELQRKYPDLLVRWEGQKEQSNESMASLTGGLLVAMAAMYVLLTFEFNSYFQPLLIMAIIPFGICGAIYGHALLGMSLTLFSLFGIVTLTGVVVNDSIVLVDFINLRYRNGVPLQQAILEAGQRRLRPIFLTSITTIAGLFPLLLETSFQAQILVPMAVSICFGLTFSTVLCLFLVPTFYYLHAKWTGRVDEIPEELAGEGTGVADISMATVLN
jgi:HAE1 family hydrophobic/amphiphilic exporter-1